MSYIGGNGISSNKSEEHCSRNLKQIIEHVISHQGCILYLCTLCPRKDADVIPLNDYIKQLTEIYGLHLIDTYSSFVYQNGSTVNGQYMRDKIHLNKSGSSIFVGVLNNSVQIIKTNPNTSPRERMPFSEATSTQSTRSNYQHRSFPSQPWQQQRSSHGYHDRTTYMRRRLNATPNSFNTRRNENWRNNSYNTTQYRQW